MVYFLVEQFEEQFVEVLLVLDQGFVVFEMFGDGEVWVYLMVEELFVLVLLCMEEVGIEFDIEFFVEMLVEFGKEIEWFEEEIYEIVGECFNVNLLKKFGEIMYECFGYLIVKCMCKMKSYLIDVVILEELVVCGFDLLVKLMDYCEYLKLCLIYFEVLLLFVVEDGWLYMYYQQVVVVMGCLLLMNFNLQNILICIEVGQCICKGFCVVDGYWFFVVDYSQIELCIFVYIVGVEVLIEVFNVDVDIYCLIVGLVFGVVLEFVSDEQCCVVKMINFGIIYGMSVFGFSQCFGILCGDVKNFIEVYFEQFLVVQDYIEMIFEQVEQEGCVQMLYGCLCWLFDINSCNCNMCENVKCMVINVCIQGIVVDVQKLVMIVVDDCL